MPQKKGIKPLNCEEFRETKIFSFSVFPSWSLLFGAHVNKAFCITKMTSGSILLLDILA